MKKKKRSTFFRFFPPCDAMSFSRLSSSPSPSYVPVITTSASPLRDRLPSDTSNVRTKYSSTDRPVGLLVDALAAEHREGAAAQARVRGVDH